MDQDQRKRWCHRAGPSIGLHRSQTDGDDPARNAASRREIWHGHNVCRRRTGRRGNFRESSVTRRQSWQQQPSSCFPKTIKGGSFLIEDRRSAHEIFTPEDFSPKNTAPLPVPRRSSIRRKSSRTSKPSRARRLRISRSSCLRKSAELGLVSAITTPERYGGMEDSTSPPRSSLRSRFREGRVLFGLARSARRHRHHAAVALRN